MKTFEITTKKIYHLSGEIKANNAKEARKIFEDGDANCLWAVSGESHEIFCSIRMIKQSKDRETK